LLPLVRRASSLRSRDERLALYRQVDKTLVTEKAQFVPTTYEIWYMIHRPWVRGLWMHPLGFGPFDDVVVQHSAAS
jgi:ABC-type transport system substrate-binding protein